MNKKLLLLLPALLLTLSACGEDTETVPTTTAPLPTLQQTATVAGLEITSVPTEPPTEAPATEAPTEAVTAYGEGTYYLTAVLNSGADGEFIYDELTFVDGKLTIHFFSSSQLGKGGYGPNCSDELQFSPCFTMTVEEAIAYYEAQGCTVTVQEA
ncbi:MAG TPA: hypothetical protein IAC31_02625 [Candidatus Faecousia intestinigallinarum]|nr:hypothetical protein [Candidatus Faecousia intestinigallinarum]